MTRTRASDLTDLGEGGNHNVEARRVWQPACFVSPLLQPLLRAIDIMLARPKAAETAEPRPSQGVGQDHQYASDGGVVPKGKMHHGSLACKGAPLTPLP